MRVFAAIDADLIGLIAFFVISGLSALSGWLQKRRGHAGEQWPEPQIPPVQRPSKEPPTPAAPAAPARRSAPKPKPMADWEAALKRMLEDLAPSESPPAPSKPVFSPPPVMAPVRPVPATRPNPQPARPARADKRSLSPAPSLVPPPPSPEFSRELADPSQLKRAAGQLANFTEATAAFGRASRLRSSVASRMENVDRLMEQGRVALTRNCGTAVAGVPVDGRVIRQMLSQPATLRSAWTASIILGRPVGDS